MVPGRHNDAILSILYDVLPNARGQLTVLKAYIDRGARPDAGRLMCVACVVFRPDYFAEFSRRWNRMLRRLGADAFHATDFYPRARVFSPRKIDSDKMENASRLIPSLINAYTEWVSVTSFSEDEFKALAPPKFVKHFGSVHVFATKLAILTSSRIADRRHYVGPIAYFIETGDPEESAIHAAFQEFGTDPFFRNQIRYQSHTFVKKGTTRGTEAADFMAWHWNKYFAETFVTKIRPVRADLKAVVTGINEDKYQQNHFSGEKLKQCIRKGMASLLLPD